MSEQITLLPGFKEIHPIISIREMKPGKSRDAAIAQLQKQAENWLNENKQLGIYIAGNVASSKNSKEIGSYKKYDENKVLQKHSILRNSAVTERYIITTRPQWVNNRRRFKSLSEGLKMPVKIEFTFIRDSLRRFDFVNAAQLPLDIMAEQGYIIDDESCYVIPVFNETVYYSSKYAGVLIKIINSNELKPIF